MRSGSRAVTVQAHTRGAAAGQLILPLTAEPVPAATPVRPFETTAAPGAADAPLAMPSSSSSVLPILPGPNADPPVVVFVRHRLARRYILRVEPDGALRVTIPRGGSRHGALDFIERQRLWIERQRREGVDPVPGAREWRRGTTILFRGAPVTFTIDREHGAPCVCFGSERIALSEPDADLRPVVTRHFRRLALHELVPRLERLACDHGLIVRKVIIRNQRSLWGSCSPSGTISLNWRLMQMPAAVAEYVMLHELLHLREANHSPRFWRHVEKACPDFEHARRWLRRHGRGLW